MKFCSHCGKELRNEAVICPKCGCKTGYKHRDSSNQGQVLSLASFIFMIIVSIIQFLPIFFYVPVGKEYLVLLYFIPLLWRVPMIINLKFKINEKRKIGMAFKICTLLFVDLIAGILLLCRNENEYI